MDHRSQRVNRLPLRPPAPTDLLYSCYVEGRSAREHVSVDGRPATATVRVTGHDPESLAWPSTATCRDQNTAGYPGPEVSVRDPADGRTRADCTFSCQSVTAG